MTTTIEMKMGHVVAAGAIFPVPDSDAAPSEYCDDTTKDLLVVIKMPSRWMQHRGAISGWTIWWMDGIGSL